MQDKTWRCGKKNPKQTNSHLYWFGETTRGWIIAKVKDGLQQLEEQSTGENWEQRTARSCNTNRKLCCGELLFWLVRTPLALPAQGSDVSYCPNSHISPATHANSVPQNSWCSYTVFARPLAQFKFFRCISSSENPSAFFPWQNKAFDKQQQAVF